MLFRAATLLSFVLAFVFYSCSPQNSQVIAKFGDQTIGLKEFEKAYASNVGGIEQAKKDSLSKMKNYLNLYVDFRMKLRDAFVRGYDQDSSLQAEIRNYKKEIGVTYILDKKLIEPAVEKLYNRRKWEYRVSHLMIRPDSTGPQAAKEKAEKILDSLKNGANWDEMVKKYSDDKFSASDGGDIFYVTAGELPYEFEDAFYATEPGNIYPKVIQTQYGFHIIKVTDKRERRPEIRASHILVAFRNSSGQVDTTGTWEKIDTVMQKLKQGEDFAALAKEYSDDPGSKIKGGDLGYFGIRMVVKHFAEAAFNLKNIGDISGIVKTRYGYHIIKLTGVKPYPTLEEDRDKLKEIYQKTRYQADYDTLINKLEAKYNYALNGQTEKDIIGLGDSLKVGQANPEIDKIKNEALFTYDGKSFTVGDFWDRLGEEKNYTNLPVTPALVKQATDKISGEVMLENDAYNLDKTDPKFAELMENYKNGIYIFRLQEDEVWNKVKIDSTDLRQYYEKNKDKYVWPDQVEFSEIFAKTDSVINKDYKLLQSGESFESVANKYTERPELKVKKGYWGIVDAASSPYAKEANSLTEPGTYSKPFSVEGGYSIVKLIKKIPSHLKTFEEAKAEVSSAYQEVEIKRHENDYINQLKKLYKPEIYYDKLEEAFKTN